MKTTLQALAVIGASNAITLGSGNQVAAAAGSEAGANEPAELAPFTIMAELESFTQPPSQPVVNLPKSKTKKNPYKGLVIGYNVPDPRK